MKLAFTVSNTGHAANIGGEVERNTAIIEIANDQVPKLVRQYIESKQLEDGTKGKWSWLQLSISLVEEKDQP